MKSKYKHQKPYTTRPDPKTMLHVQVAITIIDVTKQISKYQNLAQFQAYLIFIFMEEKLSRQEQEQRENKREKNG